MDGVNRHPLAPMAAAGTWVIAPWHSHMAERGRWQARLAIRLLSAPLAERLVRVVLFEHPLHESARFDQCWNRFCTHLYAAVSPDAPRETSGEVRTTSGRTSQGGAS